MNAFCGETKYLKTLNLSFLTSQIPNGLPLNAIFVAQKSKNPLQCNYNLDFKTKQANCLPEGTLNFIRLQK